VGVFSCFGEAKNPSKLRYLYECAPFAFLIEKADGQSFNGKSSVLDTEITGYYQKTDIIVGSSDEIEFFKSVWKKHGLI
jgi:fructose-1,6-bisphosphatase